MRLDSDTAILIRGNAKASGPAKDLIHAIQDSGSVARIRRRSCRTGGRSAIVLKDPNDDHVVCTAQAGQADVLGTVDNHSYEPSVLSFYARRGIPLMGDVELLHCLRKLTHAD